MTAPSTNTNHDMMCEVCSAEIKDLSNDHYSHRLCNVWSVGVVLCERCARATALMSDDNAHTFIIEGDAWRKDKKTAPKIIVDVVIRVNRLSNDDITGAQLEAEQELIESLFADDTYADELQIHVHDRDGVYLYTPFGEPR